MSTVIFLVAARLPAPLQARTRQQLLSTTRPVQLALKAINYLAQLALLLPELSLM